MWRTIDRLLILFEDFLGVEFLVNNFGIKCVDYFVVWLGV